MNQRDRPDFGVRCAPLLDGRAKIGALWLVEQVLAEIPGALFELSMRVPQFRGAQPPGRACRFLVRDHAAQNGEHNHVQRPTYWVWLARVRVRSG